MHLPFCLSKCPYCDFYSIPLTEAEPSAYLAALAAELALRAPEVGEVATVYLGGGTPTALPVGRLVWLLGQVHKHFRVVPEAEVTVEANPGTVTPGDLRRLRAAGVNRLSLGVQSFDQAALGWLGRIHSARQAVRAYHAARTAGFDNVNLDLMFAIPGQSLEDWERQLDRAIALSPEHVSVYGLTFEAGTAFARARARGELEPVPEGVEVAMYRMARRRLRAAGYRHYEISNYARPGYEARHNLTYWRGGDYLGLGASAHSYLQGVRWSNLRTVGEYVSRLQAGLSPLRAAERLSAREQAEERLMVGLRLAEGVAEADLAPGLGQEMAAVYGRRIASLCTQGLLAAKHGRLMLTARGQLLANQVVQSLVSAPDGPGS